MALELTMQKTSDKNLEKMVVSLQETVSKMDTTSNDKAGKGKSK